MLYIVCFSVLQNPCIGKQSLLFHKFMFYRLQLKLYKYFGCNLLSVQSFGSYFRLLLFHPPPFLFLTDYIFAEAKGVVVSTSSFTTTIMTTSLVWACPPPLAATRRPRMTRMSSWVAVGPPRTSWSRTIRTPRATRVSAPGRTLAVTGCSPRTTSATLPRPWWGAFWGVNGTHL